MKFPNHNEQIEKCGCRICFWARYDNSVIKNSKGELISYIPPLVLPLEVRVARDIEPLIAGFGGHETTNEPHKNGIELPEPEPGDLTSYKDAYAYALAHCDHNNIELDDPFNPVNIFCNDCDKTLTYDQFMKDRMRLGSNRTIRKRFRH